MEILVYIDELCIDSWHLCQNISIVWIILQLEIIEDNWFFSGEIFFDKLI